jgi:2-phospho-L-lactate guanylyltransferase
MPDGQKARALLEILEHNLRTVSAVVGPASTFLVSPDPGVFERYPDLSHFLSRAGSLNGDLEAARQALEPRRREGILAVLLPDLPTLETSDIAAMLEAGRLAEVVLCPDHLGVGTNGLVLNPASAGDFLFEGDSFVRHRQRADEQGRKVSILVRPGLADDADSNADLARLCP